MDVRVPRASRLMHQTWKQTSLIDLDIPKRKTGINVWRGLMVWSGRQRRKKWKVCSTISYIYIYDIKFMTLQLCLILPLRPIQIDMLVPVTYVLKHNVRLWEKHCYLSILHIYIISIDIKIVTQSWGIIFSSLTQSVLHDFYTYHVTKTFDHHFKQKC